MNKLERMWPVLGHFLEFTRMDSVYQKKENRLNAQNNHSDGGPMQVDESFATYLLNPH